MEDLFTRIWFRIDHLGSIETEDSDILRGCVLQAMGWLVKREKEACGHISELLESHRKEWPGTLSGIKVEKVLESMFLGMNKMVDLSYQREISCWTNGYPHHQQRLIEYMGESHAMYPHQETRLLELECRSFVDLKYLRQIASTKKLPAAIRAAILERKKLKFKIIDR
jgi:hypothetical protein